MEVKKLLEKGFYVFPLRKDSKVPYKNFHWRELSSNQLRKVLMWQRRYKNCNWAVDTGKSGLVVVDIDNKNGKRGSDQIAKLEEHYGKLADTYTIETPTGGLHAYFKGKSKSSTDKIGSGVDVKSDGGYVVAEGSKLDGVAYEEIFKAEVASPAKWLIGLAGLPTDKKTRKDLGVEMDLTPNVARAVDYLNRAEGAVKGRGGDAYTYEVACRVRDFGVSQDVAVVLMLDHWYEKCKPNNREHFVARKVENAYNYAQDSAGVNTPEAMFDEVKLTESDKEKSDEISEKITPKELADKWGLSDIVVPVSAFHDVQFPPKDHFLYPWVSSQTISMIYGDAGTGKTWFALAIAHAITTGSDFGPWSFYRGAKTLYLDAEMTGIDVQYRLQHMNLLSAENFFIYSDALGNLRSKPKANIMSKSWREAVKALLIKLDIELWIADNLASLTPSGDENTKEDWNPINQWLLDLRFHGISTLILHHTNKAGTQRGTSARLDNIDFSLRLAKPKDYKESDGARFNVVMEKGRIDHRDIARMLDVQMHKTVDDDTGRCAWEFGKPQNKKQAQTLHLYVQKDYSVKEIAEIQGITSSAVSQTIRKMKSLQYVDRDNNLTGMGEYFLKDHEEFLKDAEMLFSGDAL